MAILVESEPRGQSVPKASRVPVVSVEHRALRVSMATRESVALAATRV